MKLLLIYALLIAAPAFAGFDDPAVDACISAEIAKCGKGSLPDDAGKLTPEQRKIAQCRMSVIANCLQKAGTK